jgi:hypothetical protein
MSLDDFIEIINLAFISSDYMPAIFSILMKNLREGHFAEQVEFVIKTGKCNYYGT